MGFWDAINPLNPVRSINDAAKGYVQQGYHKLTDKPQHDKDLEAALANQTAQANAFADTSQENVNSMGQEASVSRDYLRQLASGQHSVSAEQLRQGLQQNQAAQASMAAGAAPRNAAMAARTAAIQSARLGSGLAGQQVVAGLQERNAAQKALADMIMGQRQQDMQAALESRRTAAGLLGGQKPEGSTFDKYGKFGAQLLSRGSGL